MQKLIITKNFDLPPDRVFAYLAEHENLEAILGAKIKRLSDGTDGTRNGVGTVRSLKVGPMPPFEETVTKVVPDELIEYKITKGSPMKDHYGIQTFAPNGTGTHFTWEIGLQSRIPGVDFIVTKALNRSISKGLEDVDKNA